MAKRPKEHRGTGLVVRSPGGYQGAPAQVTRTSAGVLVSIDFDSLPRADYTFSANMARAVLRGDSPELQLAQEHALRQGRITRVIVARYEPARFLERARQNGEFARRIEDELARSGNRGQQGHFAKMLDVANADQSESVSLDVEAEWVFRSGGYACMVLLTASGRDLHRAILGGSDKLPMHPAVEVTMPVRVLADLLDSWTRVAAGMETP